MPKIAARVLAAAGLAGAALGLSACAISRLHIADDYGVAERQDLAAQVADPDASYKGLPAPGASGLRTDLAQGRYDAGRVIQPASTSTSTVTVGGGQGGGSGGSGGAGAAAGPQ
jgi:hypothetical protein